MRSLAGPAMGALMLLSLAPAPPAAASEATSGFYAGRRLVPLYIEKSALVVRPARPPSRPTAGAEAAYAPLGLAVAPRGKVRAGDAVVGYPVRFAAGGAAGAVLTHEILVRTLNARGARLIKAAAGFAGLAELPFKRHLYLARFASPMAALAAANTLHAHPEVLYAHPNFILPKIWRGAAGPPVPAAPYFASQWHLENVGQFGGTPGADLHAKGAWAVTRGAAGVLVAVIDGGFERGHPDLSAAWWRNPGEIPDNGIDDDGDGYVDDVVGWNFRAGNGDIAAGEDAAHGTSVAGLAGARGGAPGVTGVCPGCTLLPIVTAWTPAADAEAFYYAGKHGAAVITNSWGYPVGTPTTDVVAEAIADVAATGRAGLGTVILFAMSNNDQNDCTGATPDISSLPAVVAVSASNDQDAKVPFSAWGPCLALLAPSFDENHKAITTTDLSGARGYNTGRSVADLADLDYTNTFSGTSASTPMVAGVFGLVFSVNPTLTRDAAVALVLATADKVHPEVAAYDPRTGLSLKYGYGRVNAERAVQATKANRR